MPVVVMEVQPLSMRLQAKLLSSLSHDSSSEKSRERDPQTWHMRSVQISANPKGSLYGAGCRQSSEGKKWAD